MKYLFLKLQLNGAFRLMLQKNLKDWDKVEEVLSQFHPHAHSLAANSHLDEMIRRIRVLHRFLSNLLVGVANLDGNQPIPYEMRTMLASYCSYQTIHKFIKIHNSINLNNLRFNYVNEPWTPTAANMMMLQAVNTRLANEFQNQVKHLVQFFKQIIFLIYYFLKNISFSVCSAELPCRL